MTSHGPGTRCCRAARNQSRQRGLVLTAGSCAIKNRTPAIHQSKKVGAVDSIVNALKT
jgi:hypothetical protein